MRRRALPALGAAAVLSVSAAGTAVSASPGSVPDRSHASADAGATVTKEVERYVKQADGTTKVVDKRTVSVTVSQATQLVGRQRIVVSWTGAHPSQNRTYGDVYSEPSSYRTTEFPMVVLQCHGVDSTSVPAAQRMSPETCFTSNFAERSPDRAQGPLWRLDADATAAQRAAQVPSTSEHDTGSVCFPDALGFSGPPDSYDELPYVAADGTYWPSCAIYNDPDTNAVHSTYPPEVNSGDTALDQFVPSDANGDGTTIVSLRTDQENAALGCSQTVPCSLVAIPILGLSCDLTDPAASTPVSRSGYSTLGQLCTSNGDWPGDVAVAQRKGDQVATNDADPAVDGQYWSAESNWKNRITIPLSYALPPNFCDAADTRTPEQLYGSELMGDATQQWAPAFCTDPTRFRYQHVKIPEFQARNQLDAGVFNTALITDPPSQPWSKPIVSAPVAVTGFAVGYTIRRSVLVDTATGPVQLYKDEYDQLRLTPRLLAKLITESYTGEFTTDPDLKGNPVRLFTDPEFKALNPNIDIPGGVAESSATLLSLSTISDVIYALTSYINADPEARAWLDGAPDPWGMTVNPAYKGISLPVSRWQLLDTRLNPHAGDAYTFDGTATCAALTQTPYLGLIASPVPTLASITQAVLAAWPNVQTACHLVAFPGDAPHPTRISQPSFDSASVLGIVPISDVKRYNLHAAALQTYVSPYAKVKFTNAAGRTFVMPTDATMALAARAGMPANAAANTWEIDYRALRTDPALAAAYPLTMPVYAAIPTTGLTPTAAAHLAQFLTFAATDGQTPGIGPGQLAPGYVPMTTANGLGFLAAYTQKAAAAVAAQSGVVPLVVPAAPSSPAPTSGKSSRAPRVRRPALTPPPRPSTPRASVTTPGVTPPSAEVSPAPGVVPSPVVAGPTSGRPTLASSGARTPDTATTSAGAVIPLLFFLAISAGAGARLARGRPSLPAGVGLKLPRLRRKPPGAR